MGRNRCRSGAKVVPVRLRCRCEDGAGTSAGGCNAIVTGGGEFVGTLTFSRGAYIITCVVLTAVNKEPR